MAEKEARKTINALLTVLTVENISQNIIRVCFSSSKPLVINPLWIGPHLKLLFADPVDGIIAFPEQDENNKIVWQKGVRERVRTYSIRQYDKTSRQLVIDFVVHNDGIATIWAQQAKIGEQIGLVGVGAKREFDDSHLVLIGDIAAMPTICYTLENIPKGQHVTAFIEVNSHTDIMNLPDNNINWIVRDKNQPSKLISTVLSTDFASDDKILFWGGMEGSLAQQIRHDLKEKYPNLSGDVIQIISYWREGLAEGQFRHRD